MNSQPISKTAHLMEKSKGQHFLYNQDIIRNITSKSHIKPTDIVLEVGPGNGNLTHSLLQKAKQVIAIEYDSRMVQELIKRFSPQSHLGKKLLLIKGDAIKTN